MGRLTDLLFEMWDLPMFQFFSGLLLGILVTGALWLLHINYREDMQNSLEKTAELSEKSLEKVAEGTDGQD